MTVVFADEMFVSQVVWMDSNSRITQHCFQSCGTDFYGFLGAFDLIFEVGHHSELNLAIRTWHLEECPTSQIFAFNFQVRNRRVEMNTPIDQSIGTIDETIFI